MKFKLFHWENFVFLAYIFSIISVVFNIRKNNILDLDMLFILVALTFSIALKPDKKKGVGE